MGAPDGTEVPHRLTRFYALLAAFTVVGLLAAFAIGSGREAEPSFSGVYELTDPSPCLGDAFILRQSGQFARLTDTEGAASGSLRVRDGAITGQVECGGGGELDATLRADGVSIEGDVGPQRVLATRTAEAPGLEDESIDTAEPRDLGAIVGDFLVALVVVMIGARLLGELAVRARQPRVMGEVLAGIVLGPTVLGAVAPDVQEAIFPSEIIPVLAVVANVGVVLYVFMIGAELNLLQLRRRMSNAVAVASGSFAVPMVLGVAAAIPTYELVGPPLDFPGFALFLGAAMAITAFPVLARILAERELLRRPIGATALAAAAISDVAAWFLIALASAFVTADSGAGAGARVLLAIGFSLLMLFAVRPLLVRTLSAHIGEGRLPPTWLAGLLAAVLLSAYVTDAIGVALIFGAFLMGLIMPRDTGVTQDATRRIEDVVVLMLLPLFFVEVGLRTDVALLNSGELWLMTVGLLLVAIVGKFAGAIGGARASGVGWRSSLTLGTLMNTRGLTELIVLNLALDLGAISEVLFTALVLMTLVTTFMAGPLLNLLAPREDPETPANDGDGAPAEGAESTAIPVPGRS